MCISYEDVANQDVVTSATTCMNEIQGIIDKLTRSYRSKEYMLTLQHYDSMLACLGLETVACMIVDRNAHLSALTQNGRFTFELNDPEATRQLQAALKEAEKRLERDEGGLDKETLLLYHIRRQIEQAWGYALLAALYGTPEQTEHHLDIIEDYERFFECTSYYLRVMIKPSTSAKETMYSFHIAEQCMTSEVVAAAMAKHVPTNSTELTEIVVAAQSYHTRLTLATADTMEHYFVRCMKTEDCLTVFTRMLDSGFVPLSTRPFAMLFNSNSIWSDEIFKYYELMLDYGIAPELSTLRILCKQCPEQGARNHFSMLISMLTEKQGKSASEPTRGQASSAAAAGRSVYTPNRNTTNDHASGELAGEGADGQGSTAQSRMRHSTFFSYRLNLLANQFKLSHLCLSQPAGGGGGGSHSNNNNNSTSNSSACSNFGSATTHAVRQGPDSHVPRSQHTEKNKIVVAAVAESAKPQDKPDHLQRAGSMLMEAMRCIYRAEVEGTSLRHDAHVLRRLIVHFCNGDTPLSDLTYPFRPLAITRRPLTALASAPAPILSSSILPPNNNNNNNNNSNNNSNTNNNTNSNTNKDNDSCNLRMDGDTHDTNQSSTSDPGARMNAVVYMDPSRPSEGGTRVQEEACARRRRRILEHALDEVMSDGNDDDDEDDDDDDDDEVADEAVSDDGGGVAGPRQGVSDSFLHLSAASAQRKELMEAAKAEEGGSAAHTDEASGTIASPTGRATPAEEAQYVFNVMADYGILPDNRLLRVLVNRLKEHECDVAMMEVTLQSMFYHNRQSRGARPPVPCRSCLPLLHLYLRRRMRHRAIELVRWVVLEFYEYTALFQADWGGKAVPTSGMAGEAAGAAAEGSMSGALGGSGIAAGGLVGCGVNNNNNSNTNTINPRDAVERAEEPNSVTFMKFIHVSMRAGPLDWTLGVLALTLAIVDGELIPRILSSLLHFYDSTPARSVHREVMCALHHCGWKRDKILCCDALMLEPHEQMQGGALSAEPTTNTNTNTNAAEDALAEGRAHSASGVYTQAMHEAGSHPSHTRGPSAAPTLLSYMNIVLREMGMSRTVTEWFRMRLLDARAAALKHSRGCVRAGG